MRELGGRAGCSPLTTSLIRDDPPNLLCLSTTSGNIGPRLLLSLAMINDTAANIRCLSPLAASTRQRDCCESHVATGATRSSNQEKEDLAGSKQYMHQRRIIEAPTLLLQVWVHATTAALTREKATALLCTALMGIGLLSLSFCRRRMIEVCTDAASDDKDVQQGGARWKLGSIVIRQQRHQQQRI